MLKRLTKWFTESRQWRREHTEAWSGWTEPIYNNLSRLQAECEAAISKTLIEVGSTLSERIVRPLHSGDSEITMKLAKSSFVVFLYNDSISSAGENGEFWFEEPDFRTPQELIQTAVSRIRQVAMSSHESAA